MIKNSDRGVNDLGLTD